MFTPPPSPLPRDFGVSALDTTTSQSGPTSSSSEPSPDALSPFAGSSRSPSGSSLSPMSSASYSSNSSPLTPTHGSGAFAQAASRDFSSISLGRPPAGKNHASSASASSRSSKMMTHARNSTIAVLAGDKAALARAVSQVDSNKKAQGRNFRLIAFAVPLLLVAITVIAQRWRTSSAPTLHEAFTPGIVIDVWRRQEDDGVSASLSASLSLAGSSTGSSGSPSPTNTATPVGQVPAAPLDDAVVVLPTPFPQPFDTTMGNNFTSTSCANFFSTFTQSKGFRSCRSFGMLLANSHAWFSAARAATPAANVAGGIDAMNNLVWGTCHTNTPRGECETTMAGLESQIRTECRQELKETHALAVAALVGFSNWRLYRDLGCIINQRTNTYCYLEALNSNDAEDAYLYSLPLGLDIRTPKPTCSKCSQQVMATLREYATNATLPIARTYPDVQNATAQKCGQDYALPAVVVGAAGARATIALTLVLLAAFFPLISLL